MRAAVAALAGSLLLILAGAPSLAASPARTASAAQAASPSQAGELYGFGDNYFGQLGSTLNNGTNAATPTPALVSLPGADGPVKEIAAGLSHTLVLTSTGELYAFGENDYGQLGVASNEETVNANPTPVPVSLPGAEGPVTEIAAGRSHSLAVTSTGQLYAFGDNAYGQLGGTTNNGSENANPPALVTLPEAAGPVTLIAAGGMDSFALTSTGQLYAFGENLYGQLGTSTNDGTEAPTPPTVVTLPGATGPVTEVAPGVSHTLVLTSTGQLYAFGENQYGQLGSSVNAGTMAPNPVPSLVALPGAEGRVTQIAAGGEHSLALTSTGQLYAFGENFYGQLGVASNEETFNPNPGAELLTLPGDTGPAVQIDGGESQSFAVTATGQLFAFGENNYGQLGTTVNNLAIAANPTPTLVPLPAGTTIDDVARGPDAAHTLALVADLAATSTTLPPGRVGVPYSATATATGGGGPYRWSATGLPVGLSIDPSSGRINGTATATGTATVAVTVTDSYGVRALTPGIPLTITPAVSPPPVISSAHLTNKRFRVGKGSTALYAERGPAGTSVDLTLSTAAQLEITIRQTVAGLFKGRRCLSPSRALRRERARLCYHTVVRGTLWRGDEPAGADSIAFTGRIGRKILSPGTYRAVLLAANAAGHSRSVTLGFTILR
jgi:alpha-tubulin suppressor-like RCC1 family protein